MSPGVVESAIPGETCIEKVDGVEHGAPAAHALIVGGKRMPYCQTHALYMMNLSLAAAGNMVEERSEALRLVHGRVSKVAAPRAGGCALPLVGLLLAGSGIVQAVL